MRKQKGTDCNLLIYQDDGIIVLFFNDEKYLFLQRTLNHPLVITCCTATIAYSLHATFSFFPICF